MEISDAVGGVIAKIEDDDDGFGPPTRATVTLEDGRALAFGACSCCGLGIDLTAAPE